MVKLGSALKTLRNRAAAVQNRRSSDQEKIAFIFSGGGNLGAVQVGMLRALVEAAIVPDLIVGCSVGAINGAAFAAEPNIDGVNRLTRLWDRMGTGEPNLMPPSRFLPMLAQLARKGESLHDRETLANLLDDELPVKTFDDLAIDFSCVATNLVTATEHWFDSGRLVPALLSSAALPAVYPAFETSAGRFIDGGVLHEIHVHRAIELGATTIYVLHVGHLEGRDLDVQRPFDGISRAYWVARRYRMEEDLRSVPKSVTLHRLPAGSMPRLRFDDFSNSSELAKLAYSATTEYLKTGHSPAPISGPVSNAADSDDDEDDFERELAEIDVVRD